MVREEATVKSVRLAGALLVALLFALPSAAWAQGYRNIGIGAENGVIASVNGGSIQLQNGRTVFMKQGTVINPTGTNLQPGMRVRVDGTAAGNGAVNASVIDVVGDWHGDSHGYYNSYGGHTGNNGYNGGNMNGGDMH